MSQLTTDTSEPTLPAINKVHTSCRECCFRVGRGETQTGCQLGRTDIYREQGALVECYDQNGDEFYIVNGRHCLSRRDDAWANRIPEDQRKSRVRTEMMVRMDVIILADGCDTAALGVTLASLKAQVLGPCQVVVVSLDPIVVPNIIACLRDSAGNLNWTVTGPIQKVSTTGAIDMGFQRCKGSFYAVCRPGFAFPEKFVLNLDRAINDRLERFSVLRPLPDGNALVVHHGFHRHPAVGGNADVQVSPEGQSPFLLTGVLEKAEYLASMDNVDYMVGDVNALMGD